MIYARNTEEVILILSMNMQMRWFLSISLSFMALASSEAEASPAVAPLSHKDSKKVEALALRQSCRMFGDCDVLLSDLGIKMMIKKSGLTCLLLAPYKEVICYSQPSGKIYRTPFTKFRNAFSTSMTLFSFTLEDVKLQAAGHVDKFGVSLKKFESTEAFGKAQLAKLKKHEASGGSPVKLYYLAYDQLKYDRSQGQMMERLYAVPRLGMFPVSVDYRSAEEAHVSYLITDKVIKTTVPISEFAIPNNLKPAKEMQETLESGSSSEAMQLMMGK
ncbi:hypothetical protein BH11CYA1_BH11CYA1_38370 [soil metagenome]